MKLYLYTKVIFSKADEDTHFSPFFLSFVRMISTVLRSNMNIFKTNKLPSRSFKSLCTRMHSGDKIVVGNINIDLYAANILTLHAFLQINEVLLLR